MSRTTLAASKAELVGLLWDGAPTFSAAGVAAGSIHVYDFEPRSLDYPWNVTVATAGMTPDSWVLAVRIYANISDPKTAQDLLDLMIPAVNSAIAGNGGFGPSAWEVSWDDQLEVLVATTLLDVGREDLYGAGY